MYMDDKRIDLEYQIRKKNSFLAYVIYIFFGIFGGHRFYLGKYYTGILMPVLIFGGTIMGSMAGHMTADSREIYAGVFLLLTFSFAFIGGYILFALYDLATLWKQVEDYNRSVLNQVYSQGCTEKSIHQNPPDVGNEVSQVKESFDIDKS